LLHPFFHHLAPFKAPPSSPRKGWQCVYFLITT
ncbi:hypothetical protein NT07LI_3328, partial [Listeria innocua FSL S4-378]